jgi:hypothetical protein
MDIERKFKESKYFLNQVEKLEHTPDEMIYNLNAFLSSSKSITDYYGKKLGANSNNWYRDLEKQFPLIEYFRLKRNFVIHEGYLNLDTKTQVNHVEYISTSISVSINVYKVDKNGVPIIDDNHVEELDLNDTLSEKPLYGKSDNTGVIANRYYYFEDFPERSVLELCGQYLEELQQACSNLRIDD